MLIQDLAAQARIEEYNCATKLHSGDIEGAKRANIFRRAFLKVGTDFLEKLNNDKDE